MILFLLILGALGVMVLSFVVMTSFLRRRVGVQPTYTRLFFMIAVMGCFLIVIYVLQAFRSRHTNMEDRATCSGRFSPSCGYVSSVRLVLQRQTSGTILMDLGQPPAQVPNGFRGSNGSAGDRTVHES